MKYLTKFTKIDMCGVQKLRMKMGECAFLERSWEVDVTLLSFVKSCRGEKHLWSYCLFSSFTAVVMVREFNSGCSPSSFPNAKF